MEMGEMKPPAKPHIVCIPYPVQGHITPMLKLAKLHYKAGFHISFVNTHHNHQRLLRSRGLLPASSPPVGLSPSFRFLSIPDGLPAPRNPDSTPHFPTLSSLMNSTIRQPFMDLLASDLLLSNERDQISPPPVSFIISDVAFTFTFDVSKGLGFRWCCFGRLAPVLCWGTLCINRSKTWGIVPLQDWIPSMEGIRLKNLPSLIRTTDIDDIFFNMFIKRVDYIKSSAPLILHTFDALEYDTIQSLSTLLPNSPFFSIGPLQLLLNDLRIDENKETSSVKSNLWKEDSQCITWLDSKPPKSVIYVNFGSLTVLTPSQIEELAWSLVNSKKNFLWIVRPDLVAGDQDKSSIFSPQFQAEIKGRGSIQS